jgi:uridine phosphorylase
MPRHTELAGQNPPLHDSMTDSSDQPSCPPILRGKRYDQVSTFTAENLLREARRQKGLVEAPVPAVCVLDPDGDIVRFLSDQEGIEPDQHWVCYHTDLFRLELEGHSLGVVGRAVGAAFAVLVAEQLFASGCKVLISITSAGRIRPIGDPPYFVLIESGLRDEGTSYHYLPPSEYAVLASHLRDRLSGAFDGLPVPVHSGAAWTTDAPYRETESAIAIARSEGILAVEMEAAALYALAEARQYPIVCLAHVTNQMATVAGDFEKGESGGSIDALRVLGRIAAAVEDD